MHSRFRRTHNVPIICVVLCTTLARHDIENWHDFMGLFTDTFRFVLSACCVFICVRACVRDSLLLPRSSTNFIYYTWLSSVQHGIAKPKIGTRKRCVNDSIILHYTCGLNLIVENYEQVKKSEEKEFEEIRCNKNDAIGYSENEIALPALPPRINKTKKNSLRIHTLRTYAAYLRTNKCIHRRHQRRITLRAPADSRQ